VQLTQLGPINIANGLMFVLTLAGGLCCAWFIYPILCWCWCLAVGTSSISWAQLSRFNLKTETESSLQKVLCFKQKQDGGYVQKHNSCINIPSSHTLDLTGNSIGKAIPVTGCGDPWGSETSRLPHFLDNWLTGSGEVTSLTRRQAALYRQEDSWYSFLLEAESTPGP
jgi:hypothetical protein